MRAVLRRLSSFGWLIHDLETQVGDAVAVLKASESEGAAVIGLNDGTIVATLLAAAHPELCRSLALYTLTAGHTLAAGQPLKSIDEVIETVMADALNDRSGVELLAPSRRSDEGFDRQLARLQRFSVRPGAYGHYYRQTMEADVAGVLPSIRTPTLVLDRTGDRMVPWRSPVWPRRRSRGTVRRAPGHRPPGLLRGRRRPAGRGRGVPHRRPHRRRPGPEADHAAVHRHRQLDNPGRGDG